MSRLTGAGLAAKPASMKRLLACLALVAAAPAPATTQQAPPPPASAPPAGHAAAHEAARRTPVVHPPHAPPRHKAKPAAPASPPPPPPPADTPPAPPPPAPPTGSGLPLPRFAALKTDDVNMRGGPGTRYPIEWVYKRRDLPVEIEREFEVWRLVEDSDGIKGWVHQATLTGHRGFVVTAENTTLRATPADTADAVAILKRGVIGHLRACDAASAWCEAQVGDYRGFIARADFWGALANEAVGQ